jgi:phage terminase small subunit
MRFCEEYIVDHNATQAAIRAGYSEKTAKQIGSENLTKPDLAAKIKELEDSIPPRNTIATAEEVLEHFTKVMRGEVFDQVVKRDEDGTLQTVDVVAKLSDRNKAAEALAKHYALLVEKVELTKPKTELAAEIEAVLHG